MKKSVEIRIILFLATVFILSSCSFHGKMAPSESNNSSFSHSGQHLSEGINYLNVPNGRIAYQIAGEGEPLMMCIGYNANMDFWDPRLISMLRKHFQVITFDYRGMGFSSNTDTAFTIATLANDVELLCRHLGLERIHLLGWSMGGYVAQTFAIHYPDRVNKLILHATDFGDTVTRNPAPEIACILSDTLATPAQMIGMMFPERWLAAQENSGKLFQHAKSPMNKYTIKLQDNAISKWLMPGGGAVGHLNSLQMPVLVITGKDDVVVPYENSIALADSLKISSLILINNGGHGIMYQYPKLLAGYILNFLNH